MPTTPSISLDPKDLERILARCSPEARVLVEQVLHEQIEGKQETLNILRQSVFEREPCPMDEFVYGSDYLHLPPRSLYPAVEELVYRVEDPKVREAWICAGKGSGKSTFVSLLMARMVYIVAVCVRNPSAYFELLPDALTAVVNMSVGATQAELVIFNKFWNLIKRGKCFKDEDGELIFSKRKRHIEFPKNVHALSGHSGYQAFFGYDVFCGILDEFSWFKDTADRSISEEVYSALLGSCQSRFPDYYKIIAISSPQSMDGPIMKRVLEARIEGGDPEEVHPIIGIIDDDNRERAEGDLVKIWAYGSTIVAHGATWAFNPKKTREDYSGAYKKNPVHAERDFAANPPQSVQSAMHDKSLVEKMVNLDRKSPVSDEDDSWLPWFKGNIHHEYFLHIDMSKERDDTGIGMCHYDLETDRIVVDLIHTLQKTRDWKLSFSRIFQLILELRKLGFRFAKVTFDSWQSFATIERLQNADIPAELYSVDRGTEAYDTLIETILMGQLDYYYQARFIEEMKELKLYKGNKYDHPPNGSKDTSDGVAGCVANCVKARLGMALNSTEVNAATHDDFILDIIEHRDKLTGATYHEVGEIKVEVYEKNRKRVARVDAMGDLLITVLGWHDKTNNRLFVDEFLIWEEYTNDFSLDKFQEFIRSLLAKITIDAFSLNGNVPIEIVNFLRNTGRRVSSPLAARTLGSRGSNRVARTAVINDTAIRMMVSQLKKGNLSVPRCDSLAKDLKYMTDDNQKERKFVCALAGWTDFASRETTFGRTGQSMPRPTAATAAPINPALRNMQSLTPRTRSGVPDIDRIRAKYNQATPAVARPPKTDQPEQKRLPRTKRVRRRF